MRIHASYCRLRSARRSRTGPGFPARRLGCGTRFVSATSGLEFGRVVAEMVESLMDRHPAHADVDGLLGDANQERIRELGQRRHEQVRPGGGDLGFPNEAAGDAIARQRSNELPEQLSPKDAAGNARRLKDLRVAKPPFEALRQGETGLQIQHNTCSNTIRLVHQAFTTL